MFEAAIDVLTSDGMVNMIHAFAKSLHRSSLEAVNVAMQFSAIVGMMILFALWEIGELAIGGIARFGLWLFSILKEYLQDHKKDC